MPLLRMFSQLKKNKKWLQECAKHESLIELLTKLAFQRENGSMAAKPNLLAHQINMMKI